jgi:hypothetical protein
MAERGKWQYCQVEVGTNSSGQLKQFVADRDPVVHELHANWPAMIGKLGEQGWELVSVLHTESGRGRSPLTYFFKRTL